MSIFSSIPADSKIASNDLAFAIRDKYPVTDGHSLVIPNREFSTWWEATPEERIALFELVDQIRDEILNSFSPDGFNIGFNSGDAAGQTVDHLHIHVIPRYQGDVEDPTGGVRHVIPDKANYLNPPIDNPDLHSTRDRRFYRELSNLLQDPSYTNFDLVISFIMTSGLNLIREHLRLALERGVAIRILTTDYLFVTDPGALARLLDDSLEKSLAGSLEVRVYSAANTSFHPKAYIFTSDPDQSGVALVGSNNLSRSGILDGVEWSLRSTQTQPLISEFDLLWKDERTTTLTQEWLDVYAEKKRLIPTIDAEGVRTVVRDSEVDNESEEFTPNQVQVEAKAALEATRIEGHRAGLVVMATGLGKTWLAAFDSMRPEFKRILFVAHRDEILSQSRSVFRTINPTANPSIYAGDSKDKSGKVVFASVQTLHHHLDEFEREEFDYIVIDEFHHAAATTYRKVLSHFTPKFMLGLTATPERADSADLLALCGDNLVYDCGLTRGIELGLLSPFKYRAIKDVADYAEIPWRGGRFDAEELTRCLETQQRAEQVFDEWMSSEGSSKRSLGFCCSVSHADFMAQYFRDQGTNAVAVHSGGSSAPRIDSLDALRDGELPIIFAVDLFNEGVDVPAIDLILMLRPTESATVFLQQLGRGLRVSEGKSHLDVVDLVGNHKGFLLKARILAAIAKNPVTSDRGAVSAVKEGLTELPEGCSVVLDTEVVKVLESLLSAPKPDEVLADLIREWMDRHDGKRPTAIEASTLTGKPLSLSKQGGWFGLLNSMNVLSQDEAESFALGSEFFHDLEYGAYQKSYKLITLRAMLKLSSLRERIAVEEIARISRQEIFADPRLTADLSDAQASFVDVWNPTTEEWLAYWTKNPVAAWTGASTKKDAWFDLTSGDLSLSLQVPAGSEAAFDGMVDELVEYRLHRYLVSRQMKGVGISRKPLDAAGNELDATFKIMSVTGHGASIYFASSGGTKGTKDKRNHDYVAGLDVVITRLAEIEGMLVDAYLETTQVNNLPVAERRLNPGTAFPVALSAADLLEVRKSLLRGQGNNNRRAMRLVVNGLVGVWPNEKLANYLAGFKTDHDVSRTSIFRTVS
jgi:superfamily II DNA or RNA helicase/diadenosine tetraphosphate (Ap4A) HIT family hydrolase/HKD family nuclease